MIGEFKTLQCVVKYFKNVEMRLEGGELIPTTQLGQDERDRMLIVMTELSRLVVQTHNDVCQHDGYVNQSALTALIELVDVRTKLAVLLGKFEGFAHSQAYFLSRSGSYSSYLT